MAWFDDWFDSHYYPLLYKKRSQEEANEFINNLLQKVDIPMGSNVLDLACGEGRHSLHMNKSGYTVTGIDLSERSISIAKPLESNSLTFGIQDMRTFKLPNKFDLILNLFTSFGYFDSVNDNLKVLDSANQHLNDDGLFIIDFLNAEKVIKNLVPFETKIISGVLFIIKRKITQTHVIKNVSIYDKGEKYSYFEKVQLIRKEEFQSLLNKMGFDLLDVYGDYKLNPFSTNESDRLIIFAKKNKS